MIAVKSENQNGHGSTIDDVIVKCESLLRNIVFMSAMLQTTFYCSLYCCWWHYSSSVGVVIVDVKPTECHYLMASLEHSVELLVRVATD